MTIPSEASPPGSRSPVVPVVLFAYARPVHLQRTLTCLRANRIPLLWVFSDGPAGSDQVPLVQAVRRLIRTIDWCPAHIVERETNLGLGRSILQGVGQVLQQHEAAIVTEDDLFIVPGAYAYLTAALRRYRHRPEVMSIAGWTHPKVNPEPRSSLPYFDGRACCWLWAAWARSWQGMERDAQALMRACATKGIDPERFGADLPGMAERELTDNIWAVRWLYHHMLNRGLCLRPPWSMVEHTGYDDQAMHRVNRKVWANLPLRPCPPIPELWPEPQLHPRCAPMWRKAFRRKEGGARILPGPWASKLKSLLHLG